MNSAVKNAETKECAKTTSFFVKLKRGIRKALGWLPFVIYIKPKLFKETCRAKRESKDIKNGAIILANHTSFLDSYLFTYKYFNHPIHCTVCKSVYNNKHRARLCRLFEAIQMDDSETSFVQVGVEAKQYLDRGESVVVFGEGKVENTAGVLEDFNPEIIKLAYETGKPIIPYYISGRYGFFKRARYIVGEKIFVKDLLGAGEELNDKNLYTVQKVISDKFKQLKRYLNACVASKTQALFSFKTYIIDLTKLIYTLPIFLLMPWKKIYIGDKKEIKGVLKDRSVVAPTHTSWVDATLMYFILYSRRPRLVGVNSIKNLHFLRYFWSRAGVIFYESKSESGFDMRCFKECASVLDGNGCVVMFPQGYIERSGLITKELKGGDAALSIMYNAPIVPMVFARPTRMIRINKVLIGKPLYPQDYIKEGVERNESINRLNNDLYKAMLDLQEKASIYRKKKGV